MRTIVVDPGHGGAPGVIGRAGRAEKDVALELARRVVAALARRGHPAALTRHADQPHSASQRAAVARHLDAAALISLHFDHHPDPRVQGTSAWTHELAGPASAELARALCGQVAAYCGHPRAPVRQAPLAVLDPRSLPGTLAAHLEVSHLSDPREEARLGDPAYLDGLADAIVAAVEQTLQTPTTRPTPTPTPTTTTPTPTPHDLRPSAAPSAPVVARARHQVDLWHEVPLVPQVTGMSCWAAAAAMLIGWRDSIAVNPGDVARAAGRWEEYSAGLEPKDVSSFARTWGLAMEPQAPLDTPRLLRLLSAHGPLWIGEASPGLHVVVVTGLVGDGTDDGSELRIADPWPVGRGERYRLPARALLHSHRAAALAGEPPAILHTVGRGHGHRSLVTHAALGPGRNA